MSSRLKKLFSKRSSRNEHGKRGSEKCKSRNNTKGVPNVSSPTFPSNARLFQHQPLQLERDIRLLKILPSSSPSDFWAGFVHASLNDSETRYTAISYCWGTDPPSQTVWLSRDTYIPVTPSLYSILQLLRSEDEQCLYWIDALCIDQLNDIEKTQQIRLMRNIFTIAQSVFAFIGEHSEDSDTAMEFLGTLKLSIDSVNMMVGHGLTQHIYRDLKLDMQTLTQMDFTKYPSASWTALKKLILRAWFRRSWCIQEVVLAQNVTLRCGTKTAEWEDLAYAMGLLLPTGLSFLSTIDNNGHIQLDGCQNLLATFALKGGPGSERLVGLQNCLLLANEFCATLPHDKIFSMLGVACDATDEELDPDYTISVPELYTRVTRHLFSRDRVFSLLHLAGIGYPKTLDNLPSWVPDFSHRRKSTILGVRGEYGGLEPSNAHFECRDEMTITGIYIDNVQEVQEAMPEICRSQDRAQSKQSRAAMIAWLETSREWAMTSDSIATRRGFEISFWRTLLCGMPLARPFLGKDRLPEEYPEIFESYMFLFRTTIDFPMPPDVEAASMSLLFEEHDALVRILMECRGRRLFRTRRGYLGLGPAGLMLNDTIFIINGTITPFLVRETANEIHGSAKKGSLVGECYVDGNMKGEGRKWGSMQELILI